MMQEITKLVAGETYEVNPDAGYGDDALATVVTVTAETVTLDIERSGAWASIRIANEDAEIEAYLNVCFI